jgi:hypothetical protein
MDYSKQTKIFGIVSLDKDGVIMPCEDPQHGNAWFVFRPSTKSRMVVYNGEVARTINREFFFFDDDDVSFCHGFRTDPEFIPEDNVKGLKMIEEFLKEFE